MPPVKPPDSVHYRWDVRLRSEARGDSTVREVIDLAEKRFDQVMKDHPGTPWAARAKWEKDRGYGVELAPWYHKRYRTYSGPKIPLPKL